MHRTVVLSELVRTMHKLKDSTSLIKTNKLFAVAKKRRKLNQSRLQSKVYGDHTTRHPALMSQQTVLCGSIIKQFANTKT